MKVLCIAPFSDKPQTEALIGLFKRGVDLEVITEPDAKNIQLFEKSGVKICRMKLQGKYDFAKIKEIRNKIKNNSIEILHLINNQAVYNGVIASYGTDAKVVCYRGIVGNVSFFDPKSWMTYLNPKVTKVTCVCNAIRDYFHNMSLMGLKLDPEKYVTVYKGHDVNWYDVEKADLTSYGLPEDAFFLACVANYRPRKGIEVLIDALKELPEENNVHLLLIGDMSHPGLEKKINQSPFKELIHRLGYLDNVPAVVKACDVTVLPSLKREGLPRSVIESMAVGTPAIVTDSGGSPELVEDAVSGIVVPPGDHNALADAIRSLVGQTEYVDQLGRAARERIREKFNLEKTVDDLYQLYTDILQ